MRPLTDIPDHQIDAAIETKKHITEVQDWMQVAISELVRRRNSHDASKLEEPEISGFMQMAEELKLADTEYGSDEYRAILKKYKKSTINHHYAENDHHPEHYPGGIPAMNLMSILEMLCDWKAATLRMKNGDLRSSIEKNAERFGYSEELKQILLNTAHDLGMLE